ncbi:hypothetical protein [Streptodolium elevatio]
MTDRQTYTFSQADELLAAAASGDPKAVADIVRRDLRLADDEGDDAEVCGVLLRGGGHAPFAEDNPWAVSHNRDLTEMLARIWAPVAAEVPEFVRTLSHEVMGLVLVRVGGEYRLGYVAFKPAYRSTTRAPSTVTDLPSVARWTSPSAKPCARSSPNGGRPTKTTMTTLSTPTTTMTSAPMTTTACSPRTNPACSGASSYRPVPTDAAWSRHSTTKT